MSMPSSNSPFVDFRQYVLHFTTAVGSAVDPETGNPIDGGIEWDTELYCTLKSTSDPRVLRLVGEDTYSVALSGRCVAPMTLPPTLKVGMTSPLIVNEVPGTFTLGPTWPSQLAEVEEALGQRIVGTWKPI